MDTHIYTFLKYLHVLTNRTRLVKDDLDRSISRGRRVKNRFAEKMAWYRTNGTHEDRRKRSDEESRQVSLEERKASCDR